MEFLLFLSCAAAAPRSSLLLRSCTPPLHVPTMADPETKAEEDSTRLRLSNSLTKEEIFRPRVEGKIGMYVCGVTHYDFSHISHARAYTSPSTSSTGCDPDRFSRVWRPFRIRRCAVVGVGCYSAVHFVGGILLISLYYKKVRKQDVVR
jgi:hypothetical protein